MDEALLQVGLPVSCSWGDCDTKGFVKPQTDYDGWIRRWHKKWYCPSHAAKAKETYDSIVEQYKTPEAPPSTEEAEADLYAILED